MQKISYESRCDIRNDEGFATWSEIDLNQDMCDDYVHIYAIGKTYEISSDDFIALRGPERFWRLNGIIEQNQRRRGWKKEYPITSSIVQGIIDRRK